MAEPTLKAVPRIGSASFTARDLHMMSYDEVIELYGRLPAPSFAEMDGEFAASLLDQGSAFGYLRAVYLVNAKGRWLTKAFAPTSANEGHGYNSFMTARGVKRSARMRTHLGPSKLPGDAGDAFHLEYSHFNDFKRGGLGGALLHTMFDELRKVGPSLYLGIGRAGFTKKQRDLLGPFILEGPVAEFEARQ